VYAQITVVGGAVETEIDSEGDRRPCRVLLAAVEADLPGLEPGFSQQGWREYFVRGLRLEFLKDFLGLSLRGTHGGGRIVQSANTQSRATSTMVTLQP
jgi:hypothetical protein